MNSYLARQPIFNNRRNIVAYEMLYRKDETNSFPVGVSGEKATSILLINSFFDADVFSMSNNKPVFINFSSIEMLKKLMNFLPVKNIYIEILENLEPTEELYQLLKELFKKGYRFVLDDFIYTEKWDRFFKFIKIVKFDIRETGIEAIEPIVKKIKKTKTKVLAEKVETYEEFRQAKRLGFNFFQGYFFAKPEVLANEADPYKNTTILRLYRELLKEFLDYDKVAGIMHTDSSIALKFIKYVSYLKRRKNKDLDDEHVKSIQSLKAAIAYIGEENTRNFIFLVATAELTFNKPQELQKLSVIRAKFSETVARKSNLRHLAEGAALTGLFSCLEALLDTKMEVLLQKINLDKKIKDALIKHENEYYQFIELFIAYENGDWDTVNKISDEIQLVSDIKYDYMNAVHWTDQHFYKY